MKAVHPAAEGRGKRFKTKIVREGKGGLTQGLEDLAWLLELDVEVPASAERTHRRFLAVALPADHTNFGAIGAIGERAGYAGEKEVNPIC